MKISYQWLQGYFKDKLPEPERLAEVITFGFAEVESIEAVDSAEQRGNGTQNNAEKIKDTILDIKVLPDRACYALSHRGVAYEVSAMLGMAKKEMGWPQPKVGKTRALAVRVEAPELCSRYMARVIENVNQRAEPWTKKHLDAMGQRLINPVVDGANVVMFDMGQPLHAFDADKVKGGITVRRARKGEKITTLDNREVALDDSVLVIADDEAPLAIAGIKGGKKAEVMSATKNLILESANFEASYVRKTSEKLGIKTDASKRYENRLSPALAESGMRDFTAYLFAMDKELLAGEITDIRSDVLKNISIEVTTDYISKKLGFSVSEDKILEVLRRLEVGVDNKVGRFVLTPPPFRVDLAIPEDITEEAGRIIGYDKIPAILPPQNKGVVEIPKQFYYEWKLREALVSTGFSEVMTSSFGEKGDVAILKPLAEDKKFARPDLRGGKAAALKMNALNAPLFGTDETRIFELGHVFPKDGEHASLAVGYAGPKSKTKAVFEEIRNLISSVLGSEATGQEKDGIIEYNLDTLIDKLPEPAKWDVSIPPTQADKFISFSLYPFIVRDVALFVSPLEKGVPPSSGAGVVFHSVEDVHGIIRQNAGELLLRSSLFDRFEKDGKISYAFRLVFQSPERTLTDAEVNIVMEKVYGALKAKGWTIR